MASGLIDSGLTFMEDSFKTFEDKKADMFLELERLKKNLDKADKVELPEVKTYEKKDYLKEDAESIGKQVADEFSGQKESQEAKLKIDNGAKKSAILNKIVKEREDASADKRKISSEYDEKKNNFYKRAIDQGIARSSIVASEKARIDSEESAEIRAREAESKLKSDAYSVELAILDDRLNAALESFEIELAVKIKQRINDLAEDVKRENAKILEYNNKMTELEQKSIKARQDAIKKAEDEAKELERYEAKYGYTGDKKANYEQRLDVAKKYYMSLPKETALKELENDTVMHEYLGLYYNKLRTLLLGR